MPPSTAKTGNRMPGKAADKAGEKTTRRRNSARARPASSRETIASLLRDTHRAYAGMIQSLIAEHDISVGEWLALRVLWAEDGISQRELSDRSAQLGSAIVVILDRLEDKGLARRVRDTVDRRRSNVHLTPEGRALENVLLPYAREANRIAEQGVDTAAIESLKETLRQLRDNLNASLSNRHGA